MNKKSKSFPIDNTLVDNIDNTLVDDIARAKAAQERRKSAPPIDLASVDKLRRKQLIEYFAPEAIGANATYHAMWGDKTKHAEYIEQGYEPVVRKGRHVTEEDDPLYMIPIDIYKENLKLVELLSDRKLGGKSAVVQRHPDALEEETKILKPGTSDYEETEGTVLDSE